MKIWQAILYGIIGGVTELLPISFSGHVAILRGALGFAPLNAGAGLYVRAAICLGAFLAVFLAFPAESRSLGREVLRPRRRRRRRRQQPEELKRRRNVLLGAFTLAPMLLSLAFQTAADRLQDLSYLAAFFAVNGLFLFLCSRRALGSRDEQSFLLSDALLLGFARMLSVFPGLSSVGASVAVGQARGLATRYNLKLAYLLTLCYELAAFLYYLLRGILAGAFSASILLPALLALLFTAVTGYLAIQYLRYLLTRGKLGVFAFYCWDAAAVALVLMLINL